MADQSDGSVTYVCSPTRMVPISPGRIVLPDATIATTLVGRVEKTSIRGPFCHVCCCCTCRPFR